MNFEFECHLWGWVFRHFSTKWHMLLLLRFMVWFGFKMCILFLFLIWEFMAMSIWVGSMIVIVTIFFWSFYLTIPFIMASKWWTKLAKIDYLMIHVVLLTSAITVKVLWIFRIISKLSIILFINLIKFLWFFIASNCYITIAFWCHLQWILLVWYMLIYILWWRWC